MSLSDKRAIYQVIGCLLKKPSLLDEEKYNLDKDDFPEQFHKIVFAAINNLHQQEIEDIDYIMIDSFLSNYDLQYKIFNDNDGIEYLNTALENSNLANFDYCYNRIKKFSLLRTYKENGIDFTDIYDETILIPKQQEEMQYNFDKLTIQEIIDTMDMKLLKIRNKFLVNEESFGHHVGVGLQELKDKYKDAPDFGAPLHSEILTRIFRGAKLENLFMRSAPTNFGKTRDSLADACNLGIDEIYNLDTQKWESNGVAEKVLFISTEMKLDRVQRPLMAFVSGVDEAKIKDGNYTPEEEARLDKAIEILDRSGLWLEYIPDFNISDIEATIKRYILEQGAKYVFFDYVHVSLKLLEELATQSKGMKLREDNVLLMFVTRLKNICNKYGVYISTSSQVNGDWKNVKDADASVLRGAKSMGDKLDYGIVSLPPTKADLEAIKPILANGFYPSPNKVYHIFKNREDGFVNVKLWMYADKGTCRSKDLFLTDNDYNLIPIEAVKIITEKNEEEEENQLKDKFNF